MKIAIASDHAAPNEKALLIKWLNKKGHIVENFGTNSEDSVDYPDYAVAASKSVASGENELGIIICGSGIGVSITANKIKDVRAALVYNIETAALARQHNNANVMCYGARFFDIDTAKDMIDTFINTDFEGGRHERRVSKIHDLTSL